MTDWFSNKAKSKPHAMSAEAIEAIAFRMFKMANPDMDSIITRDDFGHVIPEVEEMARAMDILGFVVVKRA